VDYALTVLAFVGIYAVLAMSYDLLFGYTGLLSIAHAAFYGIGSYSCALTLLRLGAPFPLALLAAMLLTGAAATLIAIPSLRLSGDYLVVASFGFQLIIYSIMLNWKPVTNGSGGLPGIPRPELFGEPLGGAWPMTLFILAVATLVGLIVWRLTHSPFGRVLKGIRDDEVAAMACGKNVVAYKIVVFAISGALAGVAGSLYAVYVRFIDPESYLLTESFFILIIVIVGGAGTFWGPILGAAFLWIMPESLRFVGLPDAIAGPLRQVLYGLILILFIMFRPQGLFGSVGRRKQPAGGQPGQTELVAAAD
jgi:branched-chain amino acid transport system permease protein